ncbi:MULTISPECIES: TniQ family protein [unclassified Methylobacterium]|uniref:TniQ family protein n=1 Tax=unclassified Methylobacterium TaxID=2615210 RepID=UPI000A80352A|nr:MULTISPECIES: TniQ family protein [unclassified Methylobacterium]
MGKDIHIARLPLRVPFRSGEPAYALFGRMADRLSATSRMAFAGELGLSHRALLDGKLVETVAVLAGQVLSEVSAATFVLADGQVSLRGRVLDRNHWSCLRPRVCVDCLREDLSEGGSAGTVWHRTWWDVLPLRRCHIHGGVLVSGGIEAVRAARTTQGFPAEVTPRTRTAGEDYILGRLGLSPSRPLDLLDQLPISRAVEILEVVGAAADGRRWGQREICRVDKADLLSFGFGPFAGGVASFLAHLDDLVRNAPAVRDHLLPNAVYGRLYTMLSSEEIDPAFDEIRGLVREHALANLPIPQGQSILGSAVRRQNIYTLAQAAERLAVEKPLAGRLLWSAGARPRHVAGQLPLFSSSEVESAADLAAATVWGRDARKILGLPPAAFASIVKAGCLPKALDGQATGAREDRFRKADILRLREMVMGGLRTMVRPHAGSAPLPSAVRSAMSSTGEIIAAILDGALIPTGRLSGGEGLSAVLVDTADVLALHNCLDHDLMPWRDIVGELGSRSAADTLVRSGHLTVSVVPAGFRNRRRRVVPRREWARFEAAYISAAEMARSRGTSASAIVRALEKSGVQPSIACPDGRLFYARAPFILGYSNKGDARPSSRRSCTVRTRPGRGRQQTVPQSSRNCHMLTQDNHKKSG